jgi:hypothetical protein
MPHYRVWSVSIVALSVKSHGKSAFDEVGGTLERLAEKASLHWPLNDQNWQLTSCMNGPNPVYITSILILLNQMNTK